MYRLMLTICMIVVAGTGLPSLPSSAHAEGISQKEDTTKSGVPDRCARIVNPAERRKCIQGSGG